MNSAQPMANVGMNHLRSFGFNAGRKNASTCQMMMGMHATRDAHSATPKRMVKPSSAPRTFRAMVPSSFVGRYSITGAMSRLMIVGDAR